MVLRNGIGTGRFSENTRGMRPRKPRSLAEVSVVGEITLHDARRSDAVDPLPGVASHEWSVSIQTERKAKTGVFELRIKSGKLEEIKPIWAWIGLAFGNAEEMTRR
jgi:hypothetical protein